MKEFNRKIESIKFSLDKNDGVIASQNTEASLDQPGSRRAIADLFVTFIAWTSQKASKVHKILSQSWP